jgi:Predicted nucleotide-binding protein containing TIR-like domain
MDGLPGIFIASSTEGNPASDAIEAELKALAGDNAIVKHWTKQFQLSQVYIESLEESVNSCDFGLFVLTGDDLLNIRKTKNKAPRDNVIFELGLFMGALGRRRCFIFVETNNNKEVRTPSDLLGVENIKFTKPGDGNWKNILTQGCTRVLSQVFNEGKLYRLPENVEQYIKFGGRIQGFWWNKIDNNKNGNTAFVIIKNDEAYNSVKLDGSSFSNEGKLIARWESQLVSLIPEQEKLIYHWEGWHPTEANISFSGFGEMNFDGDHHASEKMVRGHGRFFDINEARIKQSVVNAVTLKREFDEAIIDVMINGSEKRKATIAQKVSKNW